MKMDASPPVAAKRDFGPKPALVEIDVTLMSVDARYQRDTASRRSQNIIQKIAETFKWTRFGVVVVVKIDARYFVIDGQHRVEAARLLGIDRVPCVVLPHASVEAMTTSNSNIRLHAIWFAGTLAVAGVQGGQGRDLPLSDPVEQTEARPDAGNRDDPTDGRGARRRFRDAGAEAAAGRAGRRRAGRHQCPGDPKARPCDRDGP